MHCIRVGCGRGRCLHSTCTTMLQEVKRTHIGKADTQCLHTDTNVLQQLCKQCRLPNKVSANHVTEER